MDRLRAYRGQPHTDYGVRGKTFVKDLTMRDICDCYVRGYVKANGVDNPLLYNEACKGEVARLSPNDLFNMLGGVDPVAVCQNMMCEIEKMMGIYPNIPLTTNSNTK